MVNMAHIAYHRSEPKIHSHLSSRSLNKDHGAVSEYETLNFPHRLHTTYVAENEIPGDCLALVPAPASSLPSSVIQIDPTLCLTPDKSAQGLGNICNNVASMTTSVPSFPKPDPCLCLTPEQSLDTLSRARSWTTSRNEIEPTKPTLIQPDPQLTVTPEKPTPVVSKTKSNIRTTKNYEDVKHKIKHKVRFDIDFSQTETFNTNISIEENPDRGQYMPGSSKVYQPKLYAGIEKSEEAFFASDDQAGTAEYRVIQSKEDLKVSGNDTLSVVSNAYNMKHKNKKHFTTALAETKTYKAPEYIRRPDFVIPNTYKRKVFVTREVQERPVITEYQYPFDSDDVSSDVEHVFSRPEFHNSLKVYSEMKELGNMVPDVTAALHKHLENVDEKKLEISEKASSKVNAKFSSSQYEGLVGLEAPLGDLCLKTEKQLALKSKSVKYQPKRLASEHQPDVVEFFQTEMEKEAPDFHVKNVTAPFMDLTMAPQSLAFDLYRHNRVWEGIDWM